MWFLSKYTFYADQATVCFLSSREVPEILNILYRSVHNLFFVVKCGSCHIAHFIQIMPQFVSCRHVWFLTYYTFYSGQAAVCILSSRVVPVILHMLFRSGHILFLAVTCDSCHITHFIQIRPQFVSCLHVWFLSYYTFYSDQAKVCFLSSRMVPVILHILFRSDHTLFLVVTCVYCHITYCIQIRPQIDSCRHVWFLPNYNCYLEQTTVYFLVVMLVCPSHSPFLNLMNK